MKTNKKYLIGTGVVVAVLAVGGTAAFFTSTDFISNPFQTGSTDIPTDPNAGIKIWEKFNTDLVYKDYDPLIGPEAAKEVLPGEAINKDVQVRSNANYNQFVRANYTVVGYTAVINNVETVVKSVWTDKVLTDPSTKIIGYKTDTGTNVKADGSALTTAGLIENPLDIALISVTLKPSGTTGETWTTKQSDGWYYYNQILAPDAGTTDLLDSVTLAGSASNIYKGLGYKVNVNANSIQATDAAWTAWPGVGTKPTVIDSTVNN
ncbi:MAG: BsaA family SipW-dependent biofilm matrix protein [Culicoidibacterales bacterium]